MDMLMDMAAMLGMMAMMMLFPVLMFAAFVWLFNRIEKMDGD